MRITLTRYEVTKNGRDGYPIPWEEIAEAPHSYLDLSGMHLPKGILLKNPLEYKDDEVAQLYNSFHAHQMNSSTPIQFYWQPLPRTVRDFPESF